MIKVLIPFSNVPFSNAKAVGTPAEVQANAKVIEAYLGEPAGKAG